MGIGRAGFAVGTEINIVTDGTFIPDTGDISRAAALSRRAQRTVAADTDMCGTRRSDADVGKWFVDGNETVVRVNETSMLLARRTVVPVGAVEALVTHTADVLVTTIAYSVMDNIAPRKQARRD